LVSPWEYILSSYDEGSWNINIQDISFSSSGVPRYRSQHKLHPMLFIYLWFAHCDPVSKADIEKKDRAREKSCVLFQRTHMLEIQ